MSIVTRATAVIASAYAAAVSAFEPKTVDSIMGVFNKAVVRLEKLADKKFSKADKKDQRVLDLENDIAILTQEAMDLDREGEEALAAAERIRALIGTAA